MKFVILIHSNPQPWGHPTGEFVAENQALPQEQRDQMGSEFEALMTEMQEAGEFVTAEALADPRAATVFRWADGAPIASDGPYAETKEQFAGFFVIDVRDRERAEAVAARFAGPGETIELRPAMWPGGDDQ
ncbi:MAG: YciI family protein [Terracoccus sp.]